MRKSIPIHLAEAIIKRDNCTCQYCGKQGELIKRYDKLCVVENPYNIDLSQFPFYNGLDVIPFQIDHVIPVVKGGKNEEANLLLACRHCNLSKGASAV